MIIMVLLLPALGGQKSRAGEDQHRTLRYNQVRQKSSHNSYAKPERLFDQLERHRFRSLELDLHIHRASIFGITTAPAGEWWVYHEFMDEFSNCGELSRCLAEFSKWSRAHPGHEPVTIFFDLKDGLAPKSAHGREDLYAALLKGLPAGAVYTPKNLFSACPAARTLQEAVTRPGCGWPLLSDLSGRFLLVVADGRKDLVKAGYNAVIDPVFLTSDALQKSELDNEPDRVFFNMAGAREFVREVNAAGFIGRCYGLNEEKEFRQAKRLGAHHLAMDKIDPALAPWAETDSDEAGPFEPIYIESDSIK